MSDNEDSTKGHRKSAAFNELKIKHNFRWMGDGPLPGTNGVASTYMAFPSGRFVVFVDWLHGGWDVFHSSHGGLKITDAMTALDAFLSKSYD